MGAIVNNVKIPKTAIPVPFSYASSSLTEIIKLCQILPGKSSYILREKINQEFRIGIRASLRDDDWVVGGFIKAFMNAAPSSSSSLAQVVTLGRASSCLVWLPLQTFSSQILTAIGSIQVRENSQRFFCFDTNTHSSLADLSVRNYFATACL